MISFNKWLAVRSLQEDKAMDDYANQSLADELNSLGVTRDNAKEYGFEIITPMSQQGTAMRLPGDYLVVGRDDAYAILDYDDGQWKPIPDRFMPVGGKTFQLGNKDKNVPQTRKPKAYDIWEPTSPQYPAEVGPLDSPEQSPIWYDRQKLRARKRI